MADENLSGVAPAEDVDLLPETPETEVEQESESSTDEQDASQPKKLGGVAKRISELVAQREEEKRRAQNLERLLEQAITRQPEPKPEPSAQPTPQGEPKLEQFQTYEEYVSALADFRADQRIQAWERSREQKQQQAVQTERVTAYQAKVQAFEAEHPDFREVVENPALRVSQQVAEMVIETGDPALAYALAQNPNEAARISSLSPVMAAMELGKLAARLSAPQPKTQTRAPAPIEPLTGGTGTLSVDQDSLSADEWRRYREEQLRKR